MPKDSGPTPSYFAQFDVSPQVPQAAERPDNVVMGMMSRMLAAQERQNELLEELVQHMGAAQRQRANELCQWKKANPGLARQCRDAAEAMSHVQAEFLNEMTDEINENEDGLIDSSYLLNDLVDRYGPRLAHLNGVLQVLSQLSSATGAPQQPR